MGSNCVCNHTLDSKSRPGMGKTKENITPFNQIFDFVVWHMIMSLIFAG